MIKISRILNKPILSAIFGNSLEYYNIALYGYLAAHIGKVFFPSANPLTAIMASFGIFTAGFIMRPLGGIIFGYIGDKYGRLKALNLSIACVTLPSFIISLIPPYEIIGIASPLILVICLLAQGLCLAGEYSGAAIYINEVVDKKSEALASSLLSASGFLGAVLSTACASLFTQSFFPEWGWRLSFLLGGCLGVAGIMLRRDAKESAAFKKRSLGGEPSTVNLLNVFKVNGLNMACTFGLGAAAFIPFYTLSLYMNIILMNDLKVESPLCLLINSFIMGLWTISLPCVGVLADKIGVKLCMIAGGIYTLITAYPIFLFLYSSLSIPNLIISQLLMSVGAVLFVAPSGAFLPKLFKVEHRYQGIAFSYFLGVTLLGSITPLFNAYLVKCLDSFYAPSLYVMFGSVMGLISLKYARQVS